MRALAAKALVATLAIASSLALNAGQAFATHASCGDTITQDTTLDSDLIDCTSNGIVIGADNIRLNLGGHTIDGDPQTSDFGIENRGHTNVTVENGTIREFDGFGVLLDQVTGNLLRKLTIERSHTGVILFASDDNRIEQSVASDNFDAIKLFPDFVGNRFEGSDRNVIERNVVSKTGSDGISVHGSFCCIFPGDPTSRGNSVIRNVVSDSGSDAIELAHAPEARVSENSVIDSGTITAGTQGIFIGASDDSTVERNSVVRGGDDGIFLGGSERTHVERNRVTESGRHGITVNPAASGMVIEHNVSHANGDDGIHVFSLALGLAPTTLARNTANRNGDLGIEVEVASDVIDGGGNRAFGNGNPLQCLNVICK